MSTVTSAITPRSPSVVPRGEPVDCASIGCLPETSVEQLGDAIAELAARLHAATYELLVLLRRFDTDGGWHDGFTSCAHWLHWRTGIDLGAAREKVRVARALAELPCTSAAMRSGTLSYAKVRALTRVATPENDARLVAVARAGTAAQVERIVRAWRRVDRIEAARQTERRHQQRQLTTWVDEDGMLVVRGRLTPEVGAVVQRALDAATDRLRCESAAAGDGLDAHDVTPGQRRADALGRLAECALAADLDRGTAGDRYQVVLHVDAPALQTDAAVIDDGTGRTTRPTAGAHGPPPSRSARWRASQRVRAADAVPRPPPRAWPPDELAPDAGQAALEVDDGAVGISAETSWRLMCDASIVVMRHGPDGTVLDVGRRTRTIPAAIRRALMVRDTRCRFPGCTAHRCDAHHVRHWAAGGATRLGNLVLLCRTHHRAVHEGGCRIVLAVDGGVTFVRPDGRRLDVAPGPPRVLDPCADPLAAITAHLAAAGVIVAPNATMSLWDRAPFDVGWAVDVLRERASSTQASNV